MRYALRSLRRSPGFTLTAIATLAVGIGINVAVFTVMDDLLFKGFPLVKRNDRILYVTTNKGAVYYPDFEAWRSQARSFEDMGLVRGVFLTLEKRDGTAEPYFTSQVTADTFRLLGVEPLLGRTFRPSDMQPGAAPVVILRYDLWARRFGKDPGVVGRSLDLNGVPTTVIGVMPRGFSFPQDQSLWMPLVPTPAALQRATFYAPYAFGRLKDGATIEGARAELKAIGLRLAADHPATNVGLVPKLDTYRDFFVGAHAAILYETLWAAVLFVLLIVCANVANLVLCRGLDRSRELSVRTALGAVRWRIVRQLFAESALLSAAGGLLGLWLARTAIRIYALVRVSSDTQVFGYAMDYGVYGYLVAACTITGLLFGLAPALRLSRTEPQTALRSMGRGSTAARRRLPMLLVGAEAALAVVLLAGGGVMFRSFLNVYTANVGINPGDVLTTSLYVPPRGYPTAESQISFYTRLQARLAALPGMDSVALASVAATESTRSSPYEPADAPAANEGDRRSVATVVVTPGYFESLGAAVVAGRDFASFDRASALPVALVNRQFARVNWPGQNALGKRLRLSGGQGPVPWLTVVGVVSNVVQNDPNRQTFPPMVYLPFLQRPQANMFVFARTRVSPGRLAGAVRREVHALDPALPVPVLMPLTERLERSSAFKRNMATLFVGFAVIALLLACGGLYAVIARSLSQRRREIGVRVALGATRLDVLAMAARQGLAPLTWGLGVGLLACFALNRVLQGELVGVSPVDPLTLVVACAALLGFGTLGCLIPGRRAARLDPALALRHE